MTEPEESSWFAVRCFFALEWPPEAVGKTYEERITLWQATSFDEAISLAEEEAVDYASAISDAPSRYLELAQAYQLDGEPGHGAEVFSLLRDSDMRPDAYLTRFFDTGRERQRRDFD